MKDYLKLLSERKRVDFLIRQEKDMLHEQYVNNNKKAFTILDILLVIALISNLGALFMTNALVVKQEPTKVFHEGNPVQVKMNGYQSSPDVQGRYWTYLKQAGLLAVLFFGYLYYRSNTFTNVDFLFLSFFVGLLCFVFAYDFVNDFGFFVGKLLWGVQ